MITARKEGEIIVSMLVNAETFNKMVDEDVEWLEKNTNDSIYKDHIIKCLELSKKHYQDHYLSSLDDSKWDGWGGS